MMTRATTPKEAGTLEQMREDGSANPALSSVLGDDGTLDDLTSKLLLAAYGS
jgi:hypothetical protein